MKTLSGIHSSEEGPRKSMFVASLAVHVFLIAAFPVLLANFTKTDPPEKIEIVFYPRAEAPREIPKQPETPQVQPPEPPPPRPTPDPPVKTTPPVEPPVKVARVDPRPVSPPAPRVTPTPPPPRREPPRPEPPRPTVRTNLFQKAETAIAEPEPPPKQTRTAGFNVPDAAEVPKRSGSKLRASARVGGFEVEAAPRETQTQDRGPVRSTGFTGAAEDGPAQATGTGQTSVSTGGFGDTVAVAQPRPARRKPIPNPDTPVEILSKPRPAYTAEARELRVEGEVVLNVVFVASGETRVLGVVQGLGHGLDEAAIDAARKIEFKPALRNGQPVDHTAVLRIVFQLA